MSEAAIKRVLDLCDYWDGLTKTESPTTKQIRDAVYGGNREKIQELQDEITRQVMKELELKDQPTLFGEPCD